MRSAMLRILAASNPFVANSASAAFRIAERVSCARCCSARLSSVGLLLLPTFLEPALSAIWFLDWEIRYCVAAVLQCLPPPDRPTPGRLSRPRPSTKAGFATVSHTHRRSLAGLNPLSTVDLAGTVTHYLTTAGLMRRQLRTKQGMPLVRQKSRV